MSTPVFNKTSLFDLFQHTLELLKWKIDQKREIVTFDFIVDVCGDFMYQF